MSEVTPRRRIRYEHSPDALLRSIVDAPLPQRSGKYGYTRKTILQNPIDDMIRSEATDAFRNAVLARRSLEKGDFSQKMADSRPACYCLGQEPLRLSSHGVPPKEERGVKAVEIHAPGP
jgi:hypothetical protein